MRPPSSSLIPGAGVLVSPTVLSLEERNLNVWRKSNFGREWEVHRKVADNIQAAIHPNSPVLTAGEWKIIDDWEREPPESTPNMWLWWGPTEGLNTHMTLLATPVRISTCMLNCDIKAQAGHCGQLLCAGPAGVPVGL